MDNYETSAKIYENNLKDHGDNLAAALCYFINHGLSLNDCEDPEEVCELIKERFYNDLCKEYLKLNGYELDFELSKVSAIN